MRLAAHLQKCLTVRNDFDQSNLIATWLIRAIQLTIAANARARPTSDQERSNAVNTAPPSCFVAPLQGMVVLRRLSGGLILNAL